MKYPYGYPLWHNIPHSMDISQYYIHSYPLNSPLHIPILYPFISIMGLWNIHLSIVEWSRFHSIPFIYINIYIYLFFEIPTNIQLYHLCIYIYIYINYIHLYPLSIFHYDVISFIDAAAMPLLRISGVATCPFHRAAVQCAERVQKLQATSTDVVDNGG